jgi:hypothetical protein
MTTNATTTRTRERDDGEGPHRENTNAPPARGFTLAIPSTGPGRLRGCRLASIVPLFLVWVVVLSSLLGIGMGDASASGRHAPVAFVDGWYNLRVSYTAHRQTQLLMYGGKQWCCYYYYGTGAIHTEATSWTARSTHSVDVQITRTGHWYIVDADLVGRVSKASDTWDYHYQVSNEMSDGSIVTAECGSSEDGKISHHGHPHDLVAHGAQMSWTDPFPAGLQPSGEIDQLVTTHEDFPMCEQIVNQPRTITPPPPQEKQFQGSMPARPNFEGSEESLLRAGGVRFRLGPNGSLPRTRTLRSGGTLHVLPVVSATPSAPDFPAEQKYAVDGSEDLKITFTLCPGNKEC